MSGASGDGLEEWTGPLVTKAERVDLLLAVDNSASMGDKAELLARSLRPLLERVSTSGDVHLGVVTSSLGNVGGDLCDVSNPATNGRAHLQRTGPDGRVIAERGVLTFDRRTDLARFIADAEALVRGVGQTGCGIEMQLESVYHFLVQPDPWDVVKLDAHNAADLGAGVDDEVLAQRADFLRPDSLLAILMLTDEDDGSIDPRAIGGQGWAFNARSFPGSGVRRGGGAVQGTTAARATSVCERDPLSPDCTSCGFQAVCDPATVECSRIRSDPRCLMSPMPGLSGVSFDGYYGPDEDALNVRPHRMKERFGVDPLFPVARYVDGLTKAKVPGRAEEHVETPEANGRREIAPYTATESCRNPIFAASLPRSASEELCKRQRGPRSADLVVFGVLGGVPRHLADVTAPDWTAIVGVDPDRYDAAGQDPHMRPSTTARPGLAAPSSTPGDVGADPVHGREWNTLSQDLQYACTFPLPAPRTCVPFDQACDCSPDRTTTPPLCGADPAVQVRGKAYPSLRELRLARGLGGRGVIGSVCAESPEAAYAPFIQRLGDRITAGLVR